MAVILGRGNRGVGGFGEDICDTMKVNFRGIFREMGREKRIGMGDGVVKGVREKVGVVIKLSSVEVLEGVEIF